MCDYQICLRLFETICSVKMFANHIFLSLFGSVLFQIALILCTHRLADRIPKRTVSNCTCAVKADGIFAICTVLTCPKIAQSKYVYSAFPVHAGRFSSFQRTLTSSRHCFKLPAIRLHFPYSFKYAACRQVKKINKRLTNDV